MFRVPGRLGLIIVGCVAGLLVVGSAFFLRSSLSPPEPEPLVYKPRQPIETSGFLAVYDNLAPWSESDSVDEYAAKHREHVPRCLAALDEMLETKSQPKEKVLMTKAILLHSQGNAHAAYQVLGELETYVRGSSLKNTVIFYQGVSALRMGENDNCVMCRGMSACILPIEPTAIHRDPTGSRLAIGHFSAYLRQFPDDLEGTWLLNLAHMTLGEHPAKVDPRHLLLVDAWRKLEFDIGQFHDVGHRVGLSDRLNQSGGAIMDDFDNDGLFDLVVTDWSPTGPMAFYRNKGDGAFEDRTKAAGLDKQFGGLYCVQTDFNNDGHLDIFIPRGAWLPPHLAMRPSLLRNNGDGTFTDVTREAGLSAPLNSNSASWADYNNDGFLDVFVCGHHRPAKLYRNKGNGTFEDVAAQANLPADLNSCLGAAWIDYDNDGYPDLFVTMGRGLGGPPTGTARLYHNNRDGTFTNVTKEMGIDGPINGFSCWAWDFDNDGYLDIFATSTSHTLEDIVRGMLDQPHNLPTAKLYRNIGGKRFQDVTREMGLDKVYSPMGSNFGDLTNDGYLDFYLGTGDPSLDTLVPNRLFKNVGGKRFSEITASSRAGHLQKGHGVACGDWDRNGSVDIFIQLGGAVEGDRYHNVLFQNPGQGNNWLSVKLVGEKSNRVAIGARIKVVTAGDKPLTVHRLVSSGSSFGANPLEQHIGVGKAARVERLEITWPTSGTTQVFQDLAVNQAIVVKEFARDYQKRASKPIPLP